MTPIQEIFEKIIYDSQYMKITLEVVEKEVCKAMEIITTSPDNPNEKLLDCLYSIAYTAEKSAFEMGVRYAMALNTNGLCNMSD